MEEPIYSSSTEDLYARLPDVYRDQDALQDNPPPNVEGVGGYPFKRYISSVGEVIADVEDLIDRIDYITVSDGGAPDDTSDLADSLYADAEWFPWIAMVRGIRTGQIVDVNQLIDLLRTNNSYSSGNKQSMINVVKSTLTGSKFVQFFDHSNNTDPIGEGGEWEMLIVTNSEETTIDPVEAVLASGVKPAGVVLYADTFETSWDDVEANLPTWNAWEAAGTWDAIESAGL